ncbi:BTB POZ domain-containing At1g04390 isoform X2 [Olea europaea subsp. europaea]|uniref:BTB POZ domain-containing At1g04390 isoform X2 n=1 Tax=Olea europaea subsp. europaea TaxID=158383 RepID=A0A8S0SY52_OLEEU|nr:BTB POZ domain-containing At1g04390 isoform X2 [Olea europaea subsp. europaea]
MVGALESILEFKSESTMGVASRVAVKMVNILPSSLLQSHVLDLMRPLASLLSTWQFQVSISCASALNAILSNISIKTEREVWQILKETKVVGSLVDNIKEFSVGNKPTEYLEEMVSLLSKILWWWPQSRFCVWTDTELLNFLDTLQLERENSTKVAVLQLYSTLALCGAWASKLLENGEALLRMMVDSMERANNHSIRMEGFRLAQCLAINKRECLKMIKRCGEPLVKAIISGMRDRNSHSEKLAKNHRSIVEEACRLALITRWAGDHHIYFWKAGVDAVLLDLLLGSYEKIDLFKQELSMKELIVVVRDGLNTNFHLSLRPYVWDILGWIATNCAEDFNTEAHGRKLHLKILIVCACLAFVDSIHVTRQISQSSPTNTAVSESASRAVLMMVYSPCKYIASVARSLLLEILKSNGKDYTEYLLETLIARSSGNNFGIPGNLQIVICLMSLACYSSLPKYRKLIIKHQGIKTLLNFIRWWFSNPVRIKRSNVASHLHNSFTERSCCCSATEDWEGEDMLLLFSLWSLAELLHHLDPIKVHLLDNQTNFNEVQLVSELQKICRHSRTPGPRWYAVYILCVFGHYGFPCEMGDRIGKALTDNEYTDLELNLVNGESIYVHGVVLMVRSPSLLPPGELLVKEKASSGSSVKQDAENRVITAIHLSSHVDYQSLSKLLEYVYFGYVQASEDLVKKLKIFAKHCGLHHLLQMLSKRHPKWGTPMPSFDLTPALRPGGHHFSDILLESNTRELVSWMCNSCSASVPHLHVHKVILESSCDYLQALFRSGMQESHLQTIKVPVSWESLVKLVNWFYSDQLPEPSFGCLWDNMDADEKLHEVQLYIELCWLAEFWLIEDLHEECYRVSVSCLDSSRYLSVKIMQSAAIFTQWKLAEVAANYMAPLYHSLRNSGELDALDDSLVEMVRSASVRLSQEGSRSSS